MNQQVSVTVVVITRNRCDDLMRCLRSCQIQETRHETIVIDDASDDGTPEMVRTRFPDVRLFVEPTHVNYIALRNKAASLGNCEIIVSLDDDAVFSSPTILGSALAAFRQGNVGSVGIPFINVRIDPEKILNGAPNGDDCWVASRFTGTAYAVKRDLFLKLGGFDESFIHRGEEMDYCLRQLQFGYLNILGRGDPILHYVSPRREPKMIAYFDARNGIRHCCKNFPAAWVPIYAAAWSMNTVRHAFFIAKTNHFSALRGLVDGFASSLRDLKMRAPVSKAIFRLYEQARRSGPIEIGVVESRLNSALQSAKTFNKNQ